MTIRLVLVYIRCNAYPENESMTQCNLPRVLRVTFHVVLAVMLTACASQPKQPVLYPNNHLQQVGEQTAQRDIDACVQLARGSNVNETQDGEVGKRAAGGAAIGGTSAAAWGLVRGGDVGNRAPCRGCRRRNSRGGLGWSAVHGDIHPVQEFRQQVPVRQGL